MCLRRRKINPICDGANRGITWQTKHFRLIFAFLFYPVPNRLCGFDHDIRPYGNYCSLYDFCGPDNNRNGYCIFSKTKSKYCVVELLQKTYSYMLLSSESTYLTESNNISRLIHLPRFGLYLRIWYSQKPVTEQ